MSSASGPTADVSVRVGWTEDAAGIADVQLRSWQVRYAAVLPAEVVEALSADQFAAAWQESLTRPKDARNRVLVALDRATIRGFVITGPSSDTDLDPIHDGELSELTVHPDQTRLGHGSRLLQAAVDTLRADRFTGAVCWLESTDDVVRDFLVSAGWAADGAFRELDMYGDGAVTLKQVRLHTDLTED